MRNFRDGDVITVEPCPRALLPGHQGPDRRPRGLRPDHAGRWVHQRADGQRLDANAVPVPKEAADLAMDAAACIGCGACVAAKRIGNALRLRESIPTLAVASRANRAARARGKNGAPNDRRRIRLVHQHRRLLHRVPQTHRTGAHRAAK